jgi:hypothetical protein
MADRKPLMGRLLATILFVFGGVLVASPALAQLPFPNIFDTIFGQPPRPPGDIDRPSRPGGLLPPGPPPRSSAPYPGEPRRGGVQSRPLPPPPSDPRPRDTEPPVGASATHGRPRGTPQPASTAPQPTDEVVTEPPPQKITNPTAIFAGLDKITGRIITFDVAIDETVRFGALEVTPRACYTRPATETSNTDSFVEVDELTLQGELRRIFTGWMFAASPGLNAVEHPIYDVWLADCRGATPPAVTAEKQPEPAAQPARPPQPRQPRRAVVPQPPPGMPLPPPGAPGSLPPPR